MHLALQLVVVVGRLDKSELPTLFGAHLPGGQVLQTRGEHGLARTNEGAYLKRTYGSYVVTVVPGARGINPRIPRISAGLWVL